MKHISFSLFVLFLFSCGGKTYKNSYDENGKPLTREEFEDGILVHSIAYYPNGEKKIERFYQNGIMSGPYYEYYENGNVYRSAHAVNGKFEDSSYYYYPDGKIREAQFFKNGKTQGIQKVFHHNGKLAAEGVTIENEQDGIWVIYDTLGVEILYKQYSYGKLISSDSLKGN